MKTVTFETPRTRVVATSEGAAVKSIQLLGEKWTRHKGGKDESQVDLVLAHAGEPLPLSTIVRGADGTALVPADRPTPWSSRTRATRRSGQSRAG